MSAKPRPLNLAVDLVFEMPFPVGLFLSGRQGQHRTLERDTKRKAHMFFCLLTVNAPYASLPACCAHIPSSE